MSAAAAVDRGVRLDNGERDYNHVSDSEYKKLRDLADQAYKKRQQLSAQSQKAYKQGDGARAKELSEQAKKQMAIGDDYNFKAAEYVFRENNADSDSNEIDLHGLYVKEAIYILKRRIAAGVNRGESKLEVIVGKGIHSENGVAKLKPAVEELCNEAGLRSYIDKKNTGVLIVELQGARIPQSWNVQPLASSFNKPQEVYHGQAQQGYQQQQQPQYQQQPHYQQQQQQQQGGNNDLVGLLVKVFCMCFKTFTK
ncbi:Smr domain-containing protein YPL199C [Cyberlindnera jadinii]|uniref:DUF1771-domain-containing protein n=1 Tax=Cyberlindnera jadinii (strain ATCC 18201 / CBS 1600 / BCRC 20928 / JCM 3617 / NBRC 0987 / NRRL Y-1542) TaxID=983966 RepID=A0A0H5C2W7_CYBJN|nr:DUF1771-domain-containing protein [Cyberlindnera jadinii NRRL Y-1542]ODV72324.1 DUF1771-domain-containing protein [Cyberlindnera jadinii NRRL Y-1542]CEP21972.1 Smr domain-containing protein YPL199C [Cyberlindnera jadinii]